jgi:hypothetical protein
VNRAEAERAAHEVIAAMIHTHLESPNSGLWPEGLSDADLDRFARTSIDLAAWHPRQAQRQKASATPRRLAASQRWPESPGHPTGPGATELLTRP